MTTRRGFLSLLVAAPFAAPAVVKAAAAERYSGVVGQLGFSIAEYKPTPGCSGRYFDFDRDVVWGTKRISPVDLVICADGPSLPTYHATDYPHDPVPDYFC